MHNSMEEAAAGLDFAMVPASSATEQQQQQEQQEEEEEEAPVAEDAAADAGDDAADVAADAGDGAAGDDDGGSGGWDVDDGAFEAVAVAAPSEGVSTPQQQPGQRKQPVLDGGTNSASQGSLPSGGAVLTPSGGGGGGGSAGSVFFADAMLDLEMAHDLAETPVPVRPRRVVEEAMMPGVGMPPLTQGGSGIGAINRGGGGNGGTDNNLSTRNDAEGGGATDNNGAAAGSAEEDGNDDGGGGGKVPASHHASITPTENDPKSSSAAVAAESNGDGRFLEAGTAPLAAVPAAAPDLDRPMASARSGPASLPSLQATYRPRRPNRPRDLRWATAALTFIPASLTLPHVLSKAVKRGDGGGDYSSTNAWEVAATSTQGHTATFLSSAMAFAATLVIGRLMYRTAGGGDGDNDRARAADLIVMAAPISLVVLPIMAILVGLAAPGAAWPYALLPLVFFGKDLLALRVGAAAPDIPSDMARRHGRGHGGGSSEGGRRAFFMALSATALDIISRSLRRQSFYRFVTAAMGVQFVVVLLWKGALFQALAISHTVLGKLLVLLSLLGGKWAAGLVSRMLSLVASGGVTSWFAQQSILIAEMEQMKAARREERAANDSIDNASVDYVDGMTPQAEKLDNTSANASTRAAARAALYSMPEAYRAADASVYSPVIDFDEGMDDDFEDEEEEGMFVGGSSGGEGGGSARQMGARTSSWTGGGSGGRSTVKSFIVSGATVSFGSVAQCGLLGGPAQFVWSAVRNADAFGLILTRRFSSSAARFGFRGMSVSAWEDADEDGAGHREIGGSGDWRSFAMNFYGRFDLAAREFVRGHSDLAMSHVAAYFKSYQRAAYDVAALIDASGVEPIIHDDISTRMCAAVGTTVSSVIVIFVGFILSNHAEPLSDRSVCEIMLLSFIFAYTLIFTIMEPLRASIKAVYVCFAQHPQSLSQAFPLIYHRLSRISRANTADFTSGNMVV